MGWFMGITAHQGAKRVINFETAQQALEAASKTPTGRNRAPKEYGFPLGGHSKSVTWVREEGGSIAFRLYETDVVTWHPDNSVDIENHGTVTTSGFASRFLPPTISLCYPSKNGGHRGITYATENGNQRWYSRHVCWGYPVTFRQNEDDIWLPDLDTCDTVRFYGKVDARAARELYKGLNLRAFDNWLSMAPLHLQIEHDWFDLDECCEALRKRDFIRAAECLPLIEVPRGFGLADRMKPLPIATTRWDEKITMASLQRLKLALWEDRNLLDIDEVQTLSVADFDRRMQRIRQMRTLDVPTYDMGPQR